MERGVGCNFKKYFEKCEMIKSNYNLMEIEKEDIGFEAFVRKLTSDISGAEYVYVDADIPTSEHEIDRWQKMREDSINAIMNLNIVNG